MRDVEVSAGSLSRDNIFMEAAMEESPANQQKDYICHAISLNKLNNYAILKIYYINERQNLVYDEQGAIYSIESLAEILRKNSMEGINLDEAEGWTMLYNSFAPTFYIEKLTDDYNDDCGTLLVLVDNDALLNIIGGANVCIFTVYSDEWSISTAKNYPMDLDWSNKDDISEWYGTKLVTFSDTDGNYIYLSCFDKSNMERPIHLLLAYFSVYFVLLLIFAFGLSRYMQAQRKERIADAVSLVPQVSADSDFSSVVDEISSSLDSYKTKDMNEKERHKHYTLRHILLGHFRDVDEAKFDEAGILPMISGCYLVTVFVNDYATLAESAIERGERQDIAELILNTAFLKFAEDKAVVAGVTLYPDFALLISPNDGNDIGVVKNIMENGMLLLSETYGMDIQAVVSGYVESPTEGITEAYKETEEIYRFIKLIDSEKRIVYKEEMDEGEGNLLGGDYMKQIQILANTLLAEKYDMIPGMIQSLLRYYVSSLHSDYQLGQERLYEISGFLAEAVSNFGTDRKKAEDMASEIRAARTSVASLNAAVQDIFPKIAEKHNSESMEELDTVEKACVFIRENVGDANMTVPIICEAVGVSVQHLSRLFKQKKDITITEYINDYRINISKEMLATKGNTIASIAKSTGFNSSETYVRNFKKREGITPTEYRHLHNS